MPPSSSYLVISSFERNLPFHFQRRQQKERPILLSGLTYYFKFCQSSSTNLTLMSNRSAAMAMPRHLSNSLMLQHSWFSYSGTYKTHSTIFFREGGFIFLTTWMHGCHCPATCHKALFLCSYTPRPMQQEVE